MAKPFKFRRVNEIAGAFVLVSVGLLVAALATVARANRWLVPSSHLRLILPADGSQGLHPGSQVFILGTGVGSIVSLDFDRDAGRFEADAAIRSDMYDLVRNDSKAQVKHAFGIAGDAYIEITRGTGAPIVSGQGRLPVTADRSPIDTAYELVGQVRTEVFPAIAELRRGVNEFAALAQTLRNPDGDLVQIMARTRRIVDAAENKDTLLGMLITDPELPRVLRASLPRIEASLNELDGILADVRKTSSELPGLVASGTEAVRQLPELVTQTRATLAQVQSVLGTVQGVTTELPGMTRSAGSAIHTLTGLTVETHELVRQLRRLVEGVQRHWLLRDTIEADVPPARLGPEMIGSQP